VNEARAAAEVLVIGDGVAGLAAAFAAREAGASVTVVSRGAGSSVLMSGALDLEPWERGAQPRPLDAATSAFADALGLWALGEHPARLATLAGLTRPARARDRALLDLEPLRHARVAVVRAMRPSWDADLLARALSADPWAAGRDVRFEPVDCSALAADELWWLPDCDLARRLEKPARLRELAEQLGRSAGAFDAVLLGPWLGVQTEVATGLSESLGKRAGETLSPVGAGAGARFEIAAAGLLDRIGAGRVKAAVTSLARGAAGCRVLVAPGAEALEAAAVVVACGGMVGGGVVLSTPEWTPADGSSRGATPAFALGFASDVALSDGDRVLDPGGGLEGPALERLGWPACARKSAAFERVGVRCRDERALDRAGDEVAGVFVAGEAAAGASHTLLASVASGLRAGASAALWARSPR
jgi:glycerol-3-phosphate dehydrogenase subunit B